MKHFYFYLIMLIACTLSYSQTTVAYDFSAIGASTAANLDTNISFTTAQNFGTLPVTISGGQLRLDEDSVKGGSIIITPLNGSIITNVIINASIKTSNAAYTIDSGVEIELSFVAGSYSLNGLNALTEVDFYQKQNGNNKEIYVDSFEVTYTATPITYTYNGSWSPSDPNGTATTDDDLIITSGDAIISSNTTCNTIVVNPGASLTIDSSITLTVGDITNGLSLESSSISYSSLINNGNIAGTINYQRHANSIGAGNDLIAAPLIASGGLNFDTFIGLGTPTNASKLATNGTLYAFAPYNNATPAYENFTVGATDALIQAKGYRVATNASDLLLTFTGQVEPNNVSIPISNPTGGSQWNLIGNPYPSYISSSDFLAANASVLDPAAIAIYGYNANTYSGSGDTNGNFTIINNATNTSLNIAPGQGFLVAANNTANFTGNVVFNNGTASTTDMRALTGNDDFIEGRTPLSYNLKLDLIAGNTSRTSFYFNDNSSLGLDPGYDAAVFGTSDNAYPIFSHLVENNTGRAMALQALHTSDLNNVTISLGVNANQGEQIRFTVADTNIPNTVNVYLEDLVKGTSTVLTDADYVLTPNTELIGTGRFFLRFSDTALSVTKTDFDTIKVYTKNAPRVIFIQGVLNGTTTAKLFDMNGRLLHTSGLNSTSLLNKINVSEYSNGVYILTLSNGQQQKSQKVILR